MIGVLLIQCLFFADGGLMAIGCNIWNMAFYACFFGYFCIYKPILNKKTSRTRIIIASILSSVISLQLGAFSVVIETMLSGITELSFGDFLIFMQPIHLAIGVVEGLITASVLLFIYETNGKLINEAKESKMSLKATLITLSIMVICIAGGLSLVASSNPDGLEWSIFKTAGVEELEAEGGVYEKADTIQSTTSLLPDYNFKDSESALGTSFSGIVGSAMVAGISLIVCIVFKLFKAKPKYAKEQ